MRSSEQWWQEVKADPVKLRDWLRKQYHGEVTAAQRIRAYQKRFYSNVGGCHTKSLNLIAEQEERHASWVKELLLSRGIEARELPMEEKPERYWDLTLAGISSFETGAAVAAHAEAMRLERIRVIAADESAPTDIREVFIKVLKDEEFHERAFKQMAGIQAMQQTMMAAQQGREALGLINTSEVL